MENIDYANYCLSKGENSSIEIFSWFKNFLSKKQKYILINHENKNLEDTIEMLIRYETFEKEFQDSRESERNMEREWFKKSAGTFREGSRKKLV